MKIIRPGKYLFGTVRILTGKVDAEHRIEMNTQFKDTDSKSMSVEELDRMYGILEAMSVEERIKSALICVIQRLTISIADYGFLIAILRRLTQIDWSRYIWRFMVPSTGRLHCQLLFLRQPPITNPIPNSIELRPLRMIRKSHSQKQFALA